MAKFNLTAAKLIAAKILFLQVTAKSKKI